MVLDRLRFRIHSCSGQDPDHPVTNLETKDPTSPGWQSERFCFWPQEIVLDLGRDAHLRKLQILSHQFMIASRVDIAVAQTRAVSASTKYNNQSTEHAIRFLKLGYTTFGSNEETSFMTRELRSIHMDVRARFIRIRLQKCSVNVHNQYNQVSIVALNIIGQDSFDDPENHELITDLTPGKIPPLDLTSPVRVPRTHRTDRVDPSLDLSFTLGQDRHVASTLERLSQLKAHCIECEEYLLAKKIQTVVESLRPLGQELLKLETVKQKAVLVEDFESAEILKNMIRSKRKEAYHRLGINQILGNTQDVSNDASQQLPNPNSPYLGASMPLPGIGSSKLTGTHSSRGHTTIGPEPTTSPVDRSFLLSQHQARLVPPIAAHQNGYLNDNYNRDQDMGLVSSEQHRHEKQPLSPIHPQHTPPHTNIQSTEENDENDTILAGKRSLERSSPPIPTHQYPTITNDDTPSQENEVYHMQSEQPRPYSPPIPTLQAKKDQPRPPSRPLPDSGNKEDANPSETAIASKQPNSRTGSAQGESEGAVTELSAKVKEEASPALQIFGEDIVASFYSKSYVAKVEGLDALIPKLDSNILESQIKEHGVEELLTAIKILLSRALHDSRTQVTEKVVQTTKTLVESLDQQHHRSLHRIIPPLFPLFLSKLSDTSARARSVAVKSVAEVIKVTWKVHTTEACSLLLVAPKKPHIVPRDFNGRVDVIRELFTYMHLGPTQPGQIGAQEVIEFARLGLDHKSGEVRETATKLVLDIIHKFNRNVLDILPENQTWPTVISEAIKAVRNGEITDFEPQEPDQQEEEDQSLEAKENEKNEAINDAASDVAYDAIQEEEDDNLDKPN
eukprot:m.63186 g.63186  ORF g.63186 m.63186 type:complete len:845 (+) comp11568_c0_seq1:175-2709(+)